MIASRLREMIMGFRSTQLLHVAATLDLADHLASAACEPMQLARTIGVDPGALHRVLRALSTLGLVVENNGTFALTATGELLRRDVPGSVHAIAMLYGEDWLWRAYGQMLHSVQTGLPAFAHVHGVTFYEYLDANHEAAVQFQDAMTRFLAVGQSADHGLRSAHRGLMPG